MYTALSRLTRNSQYCQERPRYQNFAFCGRTCASKAPTCGHPWCMEKGLRKYRGYCKESHLKQYGYCTRCKKAPRDVGKAEYCTSCWDWLESLKTRLIELSPEDPAMQSVDQWFKNEWLRYSKGSGVPSVGRIFQIKLGRPLVEKRDKFSDRVKASGHGEMVTTFFSGQCICSLGSPTRRDGLDFCNFKSCGICIPIFTGFTKFEFGADSKPGSQGQGIYLSLDPLHADKFAISTTDSPFRVVLVCTVVKSKQSQFSQRDRRIYVNEPAAVTPEYLICFQLPTMAS